MESRNPEAEPATRNHAHDTLETADRTHEFI